MLDNTVVNVALPSIQRDLGVGLSELQWIVTGYALAFAALMLTGGKLADLLGRRLIFVARARALHALVARLRARDERRHADRRADRPGRRRGAHEPRDALDHRGHVPARSARHGDRHLGRRLGARARDRPARRRSARRSTSTGAGSSSSTSRSASSRSSRASSFIDESKDESEVQRLDLPGLLTSGIGLFALTYGLIEANTYGWTSARILGAFVVAVVMLVALRPARAAPAGSDARPLALQQRDVRRRRTSSSCSSRSRCSASSSSCRSTCRTSSATRRSRPGPRSCR